MFIYIVSNSPFFDFHNPSAVTIYSLIPNNKRQMNRKSIDKENAELINSIEERIHEETGVKTDVLNLAINLVMDKYIDSGSTEFLEKHI